MKQNQLQNVIIDKNKVTGDINVSDEKTLFMSIPYDRNWKVYVDGKKANYDKILDQFIGIKLNKGKHKIKMIYVSKEFNYGIVISLISFILFISLLIMERKKYEKQ